METTEALLDLQGRYPRVERWERLGQMKKAGEKVSQRDNDIAQGRGYQRTRCVKASQGIAEQSELSTDSTEGLCPLGVGSPQGRDENTPNDLVFEANWVRIFL